jgi:hypothetical protein
MEAQVPEVAKFDDATTTFGRILVQSADVAAQFSDIATQYGDAVAQFGDGDSA